MPPTASGVAGYRILRSQTSGGPYELVGEATGNSYSDVMLERDRPYYYVVQAYDVSGVRSVYSSEGHGLLPLFRVYLPLVLRNR
jgi:fibronectin type 3 domain-containing protein